MNPHVLTNLSLRGGNKWDMSRLVGKAGRPSASAALHVTENEAEFVGVFFGK